MKKLYNIYKYCDCFGNQGQKVAIVTFKNYDFRKQSSEKRN